MQRIPFGRRALTALLAAGALDASSTGAPAPAASGNAITASPAQAPTRGAVSSATAAALVNVYAAVHGAGGGRGVDRFRIPRRPNQRQRRLAARRTGQYT